MLKLGTHSIGEIYLGTHKIGKAYLGNTLVYQHSTGPDRPCLTFTSTSTNTLSLTANGTAAPVLYYSTDGKTWSLWDYSALTISSGNPLYMYGNNTSGIGSSTSNYAQFKTTGNGKIDCSGSIATLINGTESLTTIPSTHCFYSLFYDCTHLRSAPSLPSTTLKGHCYRQMFRGCTSLIAAPTLPAETVPTYAYYFMFHSCSGLETPAALPATSIGTYCYNGMYRGCSKITTAPALPATTLQTYCYQYMFYGCSQLTTAPDLPATTLVSNCYGQMFRNCTKLNYVKAMFTTTPGSSYTSNWLNGVATTGTFVKNSAATWTTSGASGVPSGWTIQTASS